MGVNNFRKIYFSLNTFSILNVYRKLDPFSELKNSGRPVRKASSAEFFSIVAVRTAVMLFSAVLCTVMNILFGVIPVAVVVNSVLVRSEKSTLPVTAAVTASGAAAAIVVTSRFITIGTVSVVSVLLWIAVMHLMSFLAVKKKYRKISFQIYES